MTQIWIKRLGWKKQKKKMTAVDEAQDDTEVHLTLGKYGTTQFYCQYYVLLFTKLYRSITTIYSIQTRCHFYLVPSEVAINHY